MPTACQVTGTRQFGVKHAAVVADLAKHEHAFDELDHYTPHVRSRSEFSSTYAKLDEPLSPQRELPVELSGTCTS